MEYTTKCRIAVLLVAYTASVLNSEIHDIIIIFHLCLLLLQNKLGDTPLHSAGWKGHAECVRLLLEKGTLILNQLNCMTAF